MKKTADQIVDAWSKKYRITKNYGSVESQTNITEGGEGDV